MNYRHQYHAGNYADVFKHVLLRLLVRGLQRKDKGFLYLDTHAGRGGYDLASTTVLPDGRERPPEYPGGIGRLWGRDDLAPALADYVAAVRAYNDSRPGAAGGGLHHYPGSPWLALQLLRPQDRAALCELRAEEADALDILTGPFGNVRVHVMDGYTALRAMLPPPEKRALVLIDPPFESATEFADILAGLDGALRRFPGGVYAVWYPITERTRSEAFLAEVAAARRTPALVAELAVAADSAQVRMKGCGLLLLNPPWQLDAEIKAVLPALGALLRQDDGPGAPAPRLEWLVPDA
jgi:23S rRNA (adenine2030-N6)-methyltransferase